MFPCLMTPEAAKNIKKGSCAVRSITSKSLPASGIDGPIDPSATQAAPIRSVDDCILGDVSIGSGGDPVTGTSSCKMWLNNV